MSEPSFKLMPLGVRGLSCHRVGQLNEQTIPLFVQAAVLDEILDFSHSNLQQEIGGFLIGGFYRDEREFVEVEHFVPAQRTASGSARLVFTHETWVETSRQIQSRFPGKQIVGWHHTHPGLGVFLSAYDLFIHRHFFGSPWQAAMVVDPKRSEFALFQWAGDEVRDCGFVCINS
jgi:proteasome lid subunit RPN8/RPN11